MSGFNAGPAGVPVMYVSFVLSDYFLRSGELSSAKIREMMENAQRAIAERKQSLGLVRKKCHHYYHS